MRLALTFAIFGSWSERVREPTLPMEVVLEPCGRYRIEALEPREADGERDTAVAMTAERHIERTEDIGVVEDIFFDAEATDDEGIRKRAKALAGPEVDECTEGAMLVSAGLAFALGISLAAEPQPFGTNRLIAEDEGDRHFLEKLGVERVRISVTFSNGVEVFDDGEVDAAFVTELARRGPVGVYADALSASSAVARYRELWRVLEVAFQAHGKTLTSLIAEFPPARALGFDPTELGELLALRGQISHASSRPGMRDVARFEREATLRLGRLWTLADRVILTKKEASRDLGIDELRPLYAHIAREGWATMDIDGVDPEEWISTFGDRSDRFH
jgi:hypothetical protein